jgi:hypothetical protein
MPQKASMAMSGWEGIIYAASIAGFSPGVVACNEETGIQDIIDKSSHAFSAWRNAVVVAGSGAGGAPLASAIT